MGPLITIWGKHGHNNNNKLASLAIAIGEYTSMIGT